MNIIRFQQNPIIRPEMDPILAGNINGPSLIRVPDWAPNPLGRYHLYFAHHQGDFIRLAYADRLEGPWRIHAPGVLKLEDSYFDDHIASPDVHVLPDRREIRMYFHGHSKPNPEPQHQFTRVAVSKDGLRFNVLPERLGNPYFRVFDWQGMTYALSMPGKFYRSRDGLTGFERGPVLFTRDMRHTAVRVRNGLLEVFYTNAGDCPESVLLSHIDLSPDWMAWAASPPRVALRPEEPYEGADLPLEASVRGAIFGPAQQLRDPCLFEEDGRTYLLYAIAGESGLALAEIVDDSLPKMDAKETK